MVKINIAIDGPSGVGKSTIARELADKLNYTYINTGSFYRALSYWMKKNNLDLDSLISSFSNIVFNYKNDDFFFINDTLVSPFLRIPEIAKGASNIAINLNVRQFINNYIFDLVNSQKGYILEGRDTTFRVAPNAEIRIFLDASSEVRAMRRTIQEQHAGSNPNYNEVLKSIKQRDDNDSQREIDPLHVAPGVLRIFNDEMTLNETFEHILGIANEKINSK